jgi:hypothetical protein
LLRKEIVGVGVVLLVAVVVVVDEDEDKDVLEVIDAAIGLHAISFGGAGGGNPYLLDGEEFNGEELIVTPSPAGVFDFEFDTDPPTPPPTPAAIMRIIRIARTRKNILRFNPKILFSWVGANGSVALDVCSAAAADS